MKHKNLSPFTVERACGMANGYLKKQSKGKGTIGSENLEKIALAYSDLNLRWLVSGTGKMLVENYSQEESSIQDVSNTYSTPERTVDLLREKISILEKSLADKEKIIKLLEARLQG